MAIVKMIAKLPEPNVIADKAEVTVIIEASSAKKAKRELTELVASLNELWVSRRQARQK